jgi:predicted Mrr-cat superfamily restriction endonuclease
MVKAWLVRPKPHNINRIREFLDEKIIAIGWPELSSLIGKTEENIKTELKSHPRNYTPDQLGAAASTVNKFVNEMRINDIVVVPDGSNIYFCKIIGEYYYDPTKSSQSQGYPHQRKVEWIKGPVRRDDIPEALRKSLRAPRTLADLSHHIDSILNFVGIAGNDQQTTTQVGDDYVVFDYPVRLNTTASIKIPKDITQAEAARLGDFVKTLYFE